jgi:iron(III) transport system substrate-binding protein
MTDDTHLDDGRTRRRFIATAGALGATGLAGCSDVFGDGDGDGEDGDEPSDSPVGQIGSGRADRALGGTSMADMPDLEGELTVYSGRGEFLVGDLVRFIDDLYDEFSLSVRYGGSTDLVNQIATEGEGTPADVFYSVNAGALGALSGEGRTQPLPEEVLEMVREEFRTDE